MLRGKRPEFFSSVKLMQTYHSRYEDGKFGHGAEERILVDYDKGNSYRVLIDKSNRVITSEDVPCDEFGSPSLQSSPENSSVIECELNECKAEYTGMHQERVPALQEYENDHVVETEQNVANEDPTYNHTLQNNEEF